MKVDPERRREKFSWSETAAVAYSSPVNHGGFRMVLISSGEHICAIGC